MDKRKEFLSKLQSLLEEYNVSIDASYEGDTYGIYGENIKILHQPSKDSFKEVEWLRVDYQTYLCAKDIEKCLLQDS